MTHLWLSTLSALIPLLLVVSPVVPPPPPGTSLPGHSPAPATAGSSGEELPARVPAPSLSLAISSPPPTRALTGTINTLVILVDFSDKPHTVDPSFFDSLLFAPPVPGRGSLRDYFAEISYGAADLSAPIAPSALGWIRAPRTLSYYENRHSCQGPDPNNCMRLAEEILDAVDPNVDFSLYDNDGDGIVEAVTLVHAGPGAEFTAGSADIRSHVGIFSPPRVHDGVKVESYAIGPEYWFLPGPGAPDMTIGVYAKLLAQQIWRLPDLADRDHSSSGAGRWSLLGSGWYNSEDSYIRFGDAPAWPDCVEPCPDGLRNAQTDHHHG